jgi:glutamyl-tRNA reductase
MFSHSVMDVSSRPRSAAAREASPGPSEPGLKSLRAITVSHRTVGIGALAEHSLDGEAVAALYAQLAGAGIESFVLATCNRAEVYWRSRGGLDDDTVTRTFSQAAAGPRPMTGFLCGSAAATHLFRVCAGLESLVLGEAEILGQVRAALETSPGAGGFLRGVVQAALRAGGLIRAETALGVGAQSVASAAVQLVARELVLANSHVVVVGAGATGVKVARHLRRLGVRRLVLANRGRERAAAVAATVAGETAGLESLPDLLAAADAVFCAVDAPAHLVTRADLQAAAATRAGRTLLMVDLSMPPAVEPGAVDGVSHVDLTTLARAVATQLDRRTAEIPRAVAVIERELRHLDTWAHRQALRPIVSDLRQKVETIRRAELARACLELAEPDGDPSAVLDRLTRRLLDQVLAIPLAALPQVRADVAGVVAAPSVPAVDGEADA